MPAALSPVTALRYKAGVTEANDGSGIRLLQTLAGADKGGAELFFVRLAEALARAGVQQQIVMRNHPGMAGRIKAAGVPVTFARFGGALDFSTRRIIRTVAGAFRPQIALSYMSRATKLTPRGGYILVARLGGYYDLKYYRHADHLVGNTPDLVEYFVREGWPRERASLISNFVEPRPGPALPRGAFDTPDGVPLLVAAGRLHANKAFDTLLRAVALVPGAWLWLLGEGPERPGLEALARELGIAERVRMPGWQDDIQPAARAADVFVVPSRHEPLGAVVLEGWLARRPVVAAASQGPSWLIKEGESGLLVPVDAPQALATALQGLLADPGRAAQLVAGGTVALEKDFTEQAVVGQYLALFRRLIQTAREQRR